MGPYAYAALSEYYRDRNKRYIFSEYSKMSGVPMAPKKLSKEDFEAFLHALFENDSLKVKYQNPDAWRRQPSKKQ